MSYDYEMKTEGKGYNFTNLVSLTINSHKWSVYTIFSTCLTLILKFKNRHMCPATILLGFVFAATGWHNM